eukprot:scaffold184797_cov22-Cyclotella_meneghiniana.AAC.2
MDAATSANVANPLTTTYPTRPQQAMTFETESLMSSKRILPKTKLIKPTTQVECETHNIVPSLPRFKPFDLSTRLDHSLDPGATWRVPFSRIGLDVVMIHATQPSKSPPSEAAKYNETDLPLRVGERKKFERIRGGTNILTKRTLTPDTWSPDEVSGEIPDANYSFMPIAIGPHREIGSLFKRFLYRGNTLPLPHFSTDQPNAMPPRLPNDASQHQPHVECSIELKKYSKHAHGDKLLGGNYLAPSQAHGQTNNLASPSLLVFPTTSSLHSKTSNIHLHLLTLRFHLTVTSDDDYSEYDNEYDWKYHDGDFLGEEWLDDRIPWH